jgi:hypothetical protein
MDQMSKQEQAVPRHCKRYAAQGVNVIPADYFLVAKTEYISEAAMMERDGMGNITGTAKHDAQEPSSVGTVVRTPLSHDVDRASMPSGDQVVMIVDDDYRIREALQELLAASNLRAVAFGAVAGEGEGEGNCSLWDGHIIDAIFPLV